MSHSNESKQYRLKANDIDGWYTKKQIADIVTTMTPIHKIGDIYIVCYVQADGTYIVVRYRGEVLVLKREAVKNGYRFKLKGKYVRLI